MWDTWRRRIVENREEWLIERLRRKIPHKPKARGLRYAPTATTQALGDMEGKKTKKESHRLCLLWYRFASTTVVWTQRRGKLWGFLLKQIPVTPMGGSTNNRQFCFVLFFFLFVKNCGLWFPLQKPGPCFLFPSAQSGWSRGSVLFGDTLDKTLQVNTADGVNWEHFRFEIPFFLFRKAEKPHPQSLRVTVSPYCDFRSPHYDGLCHSDVRPFHLRPLSTHP